MGLNDGHSVCQSVSKSVGMHDLHVSMCMMTQQNVCVCFCVCACVCMQAYVCVFACACASIWLIYPIFFL